LQAKLTAIILSSCALSALGVFITLRLAPRYGIIDVPNVRSSHEKPTPRGGGIGILFGVLCALFLGYILGIETPPWQLWAGTSLVAVVGFYDDVKGGSRVLVRLIAHMGAASLIIFSLGKLECFPLPPPLDFPLYGFGYVISFIWFISVINFFNFMDGIDGIAGFQSVITGLVLAFAVSGDAAWLGAALAGASLGFLFFNWHPAKIFLGDVGSYSLGFLVASAPFLNKHVAVSPVLMLVALSMWFFLTDASYTLLRRALTRERVWEAHRSHLYQQWVQSGMSHAQVTGVIGITSLIVSTLAVVAYTSSKTALWYIAFIVASILFILEWAWVRNINNN
jgi:Fuc2NAc and GlcNAc transferase